MPFANFATLLKNAQNGSYAIGAFNVFASEYLPAIIAAADEEQSPVILQINPIHFNMSDAASLVHYIRSQVVKASVPVALNLDHGTSREIILKGIRYGFPSVMFDGSKLIFEENVDRTREVVELCHPLGITVEAELGMLNDEELDITSKTAKDMLTDPDKAAEFVTVTNVDALAVAIGNAHGFYKGRPKLDFARLRQIRARTDVPLVLHGGSGLPNADLKEAIRDGITKINIYTEMGAAAVACVKDIVTNQKAEIDYPWLLSQARQAVKKVVKEKIQIIGSSGKA